jgi:UDP-glucose 4-epimerase
VGRHEGAFNIAGDGTMTMGEAADRIGLKRRKMPLGLGRRIGKAMWVLRQSETPVGQLAFALHPWVVSNEKLKKTLSWTPAHTSRETFDIAMRAKGKLAPEPASKPVEEPAPAAAESASQPVDSQPVGS